MEAQDLKVRATRASMAVVKQQGSKQGQLCDVTVQRKASLQPHTVLRIGAAFTWLGRKERVQAGMNKG